MGYLESPSLWCNNSTHIPIEYSLQSSIAKHSKIVSHDFCTTSKALDTSYGRILGSLQHDAWCVLGDFNAVLHLEERMGGVDVTHTEITDFASCLGDCELTTAAFFTWTNKTVWSKIDRIVANSQWAQECEYVHISCKPAGLFNHNPLILSFPLCPKKRGGFNYCEIPSPTPDCIRALQEDKQRKQDATTLCITEEP
ncbi:LOW QUALITY PROTEIN: hypothetical protein Cgig2_028768 [Carnegiea gigantea]|uniref:Endonuclease/exonuclease/phosphatase domain-containing protein n=1 Tax=Carnegiea gigantea TaxID=171969 RepID=A0A9Q1GLH5_9CARY|nr:LOW QUALITY PROTEIN: hypothetical protein Cgig2_028768 [Carnegiea gigantea]